MNKRKENEMARKKRYNTPAFTVGIQTRDEAVEHIKRYGDLSREATRMVADHNDTVAEMQEKLDAQIAPITAEMQAIEAGVLAWATANRDMLTDNGKVKYCNLTTGTIRWRFDPPKCQVRGVDAVLALMQSDEKYARFVRTKHEINKDAVLNEADFFAANPVAGLSIVQGAEKFAIEVNEQEVG
ncbi:host-nuclease inhibitor protein Gam [Neisseria sp. WF04]|nr:host-nuclease inhibitor protein Gam [Neisseria sp. WF04]